LNEKLIYQQATQDGQIQVWQDDDKRSLWFDRVILQSEIFLSDPAVLPNEANRAMLAHLMFGQRPQNILLAGCGGGAIARWFNARSPQTQGDAVELSADVAEVAKEWFDFPNKQSHWQLHVADIRDFINESQKIYDFILVDLEEDQYSPRWLSDKRFLKACKNRLSEHGVLTLNIIPKNAQHYTEALWNIRQVFEHRTLSLPVSGHDNQLILAFKQAPDTSQIKTTSEAAAKHWGLKLAPYWRSIQQHNPPGSGICLSHGTLPT